MNKSLNSYDWLARREKESPETINRFTFTGYAPVPGYADPDMSNIELIIIQRGGCTEEIE